MNALHDAARCLRHASPAAPSPATLTFPSACVPSRQYWDYCTPPPAPRTRSGCLCRRSWFSNVRAPANASAITSSSNSGTNTSPAAASTQLQMYYGMCANPDDVALGNWCIVQPETCTLGLPFSPIDQLVVPDSSSPTTDAIKRTMRFWDYCVDGADGAASNAAMQQAGAGGADAL